MTDKKKIMTLSKGTMSFSQPEPGVTAKVNYVLEENGTVPSQGHDLDVGMDMYTTKDVLVMPGMMGSTMVGLGIRTQFDARVLGMILSPRSMMAKLPLMMGNTIGVIEGTFTGEIMVPLRNTFTSVVGEFAGIAFKYDEEEKKVVKVPVEDIPNEVLREAHTRFKEGMETLGYTLDEESEEEVFFDDRVPFGTVFIPKGTRLVQAYLIPRIQMELNEVDKLEDTARGEGSFGSTGASKKNG